MKKPSAVSALAGLLLLIAPLAPAAASGTSLTVYSNDLALVRETRSLTLKKGLQLVEYGDVAELIIPESVCFSSPGAPESITLLEQSYAYSPAAPEQLMKKHRGRHIIVTAKDGSTVSGILVGARSGDILLQMQGGQVRLIRSAFIQALEFPSTPEGLVTRPTLIWQIDCRTPGKHTAAVSYLTRGIGWRADYVAVVQPDDTGLSLSGWATIDNKAGLTWQSARVQLVAGDVHMVRPRPPGRKMRAEKQVYTAAAPPQFEEAPVFDYHLYTLKRPATLEDHRIKQLALFPETRIPVRKLYTYDAGRDGTKVRTGLEFVNDVQAGPGTPLPAGKLRMYRSGGAGAPVFIGEDVIGHTPVGETVRVYAGDAFDILGKRTVLDVQKLGRSSRRETVEIRLTNRTQTGVTIAVIEHFRGDWEFAGTPPPVKKQDAYTAEFMVEVPEGGKKTFRYTVLYKQ